MFSKHFIFNNNNKQQIEIGLQVGEVTFIHWENNYGTFLMSYTILFLCRVGITVELSFIWPEDHANGSNMAEHKRNVRVEERLRIKIG